MSAPSPPSGVQRVRSGSPWEDVIGFSRAVRAGDRVLVSGTAPVRPDGGCDDATEAQARRCLAIIVEALGQVGARADQVVRTRMYVVDPADVETVGRVHAEILGEARPAATIVAVAALADPRWRVEIEAEAYLG